MALRNALGSSTLKFNDVLSVILSKEVHRKTLREVSLSGSALNVEYRGRAVEENTIGDQNLRGDLSKKNQEWKGHLKKDLLGMKEEKEM